MKKPLVVFAFAGLALITLHSLRAEAERCVARDEQLGLSPTALPRYNGQTAMASTNGRYITEAGVEFYSVATADLIAVPDGGLCMSAAKQVTLRFINPWTGEQRTMTLGETP